MIDRMNFKLEERGGERDTERELKERKGIRWSKRLRAILQADCVSLCVYDELHYYYWHLVSDWNKPVTIVLDFSK